MNPLHITPFLFPPIMMGEAQQGDLALVAQWLRIHLAMQGTQVRSLVREDPTYHGATKPRCCNLLWPQQQSPWAAVKDPK